MAFHVGGDCAGLLIVTALLRRIGDELAIRVANASSRFVQPCRQRGNPARIAIASDRTCHPLADYPVADPQGRIERARHAEADNPGGTLRFACQLLSQRLRIAASGNHPQSWPAQHRAFALEPADGDYMPQATVSVLAALRLR